MSAYGAILRSTNSDSPLPSTIWPLTNRPNKSSTPDQRHLSIHHLTLERAQRSPGLIQHLSDIFAKEVADGYTYPQEDEITKQSFEAYFFSADVLVAIVGNEDGGAAAADEGATTDITLDDAAATRSWAECVVGYYYVRTAIR